MPDTIRQIWITGTGGVNRLDVRRAPVPSPSANEVRIRVAAAGVNFADVMMRLGLYPDAPKLPAVPGYEVAGVVEAAGREVPADLVGKPVVALCNFGGYSEAVCCDHRLVWTLLPGTDPVHAAALPVNYLTAWQMVRIMAPVSSEQTVLIHSAAGGVGLAVVQLCRLAGARIIGTASPGKHDFLRRQGVDEVFDSRGRDLVAGVREATDGRGVDVALEPRNGRWIMESYRCLAKCGHLVLFGFSGAAVGKSSGTWSALKTLAGVPWLQLNPIRLMNDNTAIAGVNLGRMWDQRERTGRWQQQLLQLLEQGKIEPHIDRILGFDEAGEAHRRLEERANVGKVILVPDKDGTS